MTLLNSFETLRHDKRAAIAATVMLGVLLAVFPFVISNTFSNSWLRVADFAMLYIMLALGLNIVVGFAGLLDMGYIAFYAVGAYLYALLSSTHFGLHYPIWVIIPLGAVLAGVFGALLGAPTRTPPPRPGDASSSSSRGISWRSPAGSFRRPATAPPGGNPRDRTRL